MTMSRSEARKRAGGMAWEQIQAVLDEARPSLEGGAGEKPSRLNEGMSRAAVWNILSRPVQKYVGPVVGHYQALIAVNVLREFGESMWSPTAIYHEELDLA